MNLQPHSVYLIVQTPPHSQFKTYISGCTQIQYHFLYYKPILFDQTSDYTSHKTMAKRSKLLAALDTQQGKDYKLERHKKLRKQADKRKNSRPQQKQLEAENDRGDGARSNDVLKGSGTDSEGWESEAGEETAPIAVGSYSAAKHSHTQSKQIDISRIDDSDSESEHDATGKASIPPPTTNGKNPSLGDVPASDEEDEDIPLSDIDSLPSEEKADILPHQRLAINNTAALLRAHKSISTASPSPFSEHQTLVSATPIAIPDVNDDLTRELAFYKQCLDSANEACVLLKKEGVPFSRPNDYFAEMVKSDEHMGKIKQKMTDEATNRKAAADARKQRDLKKFGKQVQVAKLQERDKAKREMLGKIEVLKRSR